MQVEETGLHHLLDAAAKVTAAGRDKAAKTSNANQQVTSCR